MSTQYDDIGGRYKAFKERSAADIERPSVLKRLGSVKDLNCADSAGGLGHWTRVLAELGAAKVVGIDISQEMVSAARDQLPPHLRPSVSFDVGDCSNSRPIEGGPFDVIFAGWLLNYTRPRDDDCPMFEPVANYGVVAVPIEPAGEGEGWKVRLTAQQESEPIESDVFHFLHDFYERAAAAGGMVDLKWYPPVAPEDERRESGYWDEYFLRPHLNAVTASRPDLHSKVDSPIHC